MQLYTSCLPEMSAVCPCPHTVIKPGQAPVIKARFHLVVFQNINPLEYTHRNMPSPLRGVVQDHPWVLRPPKQHQCPSTSARCQHTHTLPWPLRQHLDMQGYLSCPLASGPPGADEHVPPLVEAEMGRDSPQQQRSWYRTCAHTALCTEDA